MSVKLIVNKIADQLKNRHLLAVFDRDGTLVPINPDPSAAILQEHIRNLLLDLNSLPNTQVAILSARGIEGLDKDFSIHNLTLAGNYGMEVLLPNKKYFAQSIATQYKDRVLQAKVELQQASA